MKFIIGKDRNQTEFCCLDQSVGQDNEVRLIELFVNSVNLSSFGFELDQTEKVKTATSNSRWHNINTVNKVKHYKTKACLSCPLFERCTKNKEGRFIERTEHADLVDANKKRLTENLQLYRKRQAIVEHPYGVIKRQWDFYYIMTKKTIKHATADVGMIFTAYNIRRIFNIIDHKKLKKFLKELTLFFNLKTFFENLFKAHLSALFLATLKPLFSSKLP